MEAWPTGLRPPDPLKITSVMDSPRRCLAEDSPMTQRTASMMFDFPQPFGPTTALMLPGKWTVVGSTNDLKPASLMLFKRIIDRPRASGAKRRLYTDPACVGTSPLVGRSALWAAGVDHQFNRLLQRQ